MKHDELWDFIRCFAFSSKEFGPLREGEKVKMTLWGIDLHGNDCLCQWKFLPFGLNNAPIEFLKVMDWVLVGFGFAKCYIDDIIVFNLTPGNHMHHLHGVCLENLKNITLSFI